MNYYVNKPLVGFDQRTVRLLVYTALFLLSLNFLEAIIWGFTYYLLPGITEFEDLEKAIYFSLVTFIHYTAVGTILNSCMNLAYKGYQLFT